MNAETNRWMPRQSVDRPSLMLLPEYRFYGRADREKKYELLRVVLWSWLGGVSCALLRRS